PGVARLYEWCVGLLAGFAFRGVERHRDHSAHVDTDRRQNSPDAHSMDEPLLARHALSDLTRPDDFADPAWIRYFRDLFRFYRPQSSHSEEQIGRAHV